jgi:dihydrolipoamide dehydrogenase
MAEKTVDVAIIGTGTAGMSAYKNVLKYTDNIAVIEGGEYGTTCARVGCMPSKLLIAAAGAAHAAGTSHNFGIKIEGKISIDGHQVMERLKSERDRFVSYVLETVNLMKEKHKIKGYAKFLDNNTLQIDNNIIIKAKSIIIATGSVPHILPFLNELGPNLIVNDDIFAWDTLPESVAIFGAGSVGLELGQALHRLGVRVKIFGKGGNIGQLSDPEIKEYTRIAFSEEFAIDTDFKLIDLKKDNKDIVIRYLDQENKKEERYDYALSATGRKPNFSKLVLENTTLELDKKGVPVFDKNTMQCGNSSIFIAGDSANYLPLLHEAADEGAIAGKNAAKYPEISKEKRRAPLGIIFTEPQIATVGQPYKSLETGSFVTGRASFENQGRSRIILQNKGLMHVYAEINTGRFLGAEIFAPAAEHLAHLLAWSYQQGLSIKQMLEMPYYHPTIEEALRTALGNAIKKIKTPGNVSWTIESCWGTNSG